jgi:hypothetical protein
MRLENWPTLLAAFIESRKDTAFQWGVHDCTLFAADSAMAMTGVDLAAAYRGTYEDIASAEQIIAAAGGFRELVEQNMGAGINPKLAQRGDWVLVETITGPALAVCMGINMIAAGPAGLVSIPMTEAITAWRIE